jgi:hypothetical protein
VESKAFPLDVLNFESTSLDNGLEEPRLSRYPHLALLAMLAPKFPFTNTSLPSVPPVEEAAPTYSPDQVPSCGGHGTLEILEVTRFLEANGIECCVVGVSALMFYGAGRSRDVRPSPSFSPLPSILSGLQG